MARAALTPSTAMDEVIWVLADPADGALIGTDDASGGYPWKPSYWQGVRKWQTREEAEKYMGGDKYKVLRAWVVVEDPDEAVPAEEPQA